MTLPQLQFKQPITQDQRPPSREFWILIEAYRKAIETLQILIWGIRSGQVRKAHPDWVLPETTNFDELWKWIGCW